MVQLHYLKVMRDRKESVNEINNKKGLLCNENFLPELFTIYNEEDDDFTEDGIYNAW